MNNYYSGWPYSDELYHHGIKGQKWGVRRYQNEDGSLTTLGKMRYGIAAVGRAFGNGAKAVGGAVSKAYKKRHPEKMSDEEIQNAIKRLEMNKRYKDLMNGSKPTVNRGQRIVGDIFENSAKTLANRAVNAFADEMFKKPEPKPDMSLPSNQLVKTFKDEWKGGKNKWSRAEVEEFGAYVDALRKIENANGGGGGKGKKGNNKK